jgi:hypothetical protein
VNADDGSAVTEFGFTWGPMDVERAYWVDRPNGRYRVLVLQTPTRRVRIYVSPTGRSVRVFRDHRELT